MTVAECGQCLVIVVFCHHTLTVTVDESGKSGQSLRCGKRPAWTIPLALMTFIDNFESIGAPLGCSRPVRGLEPLFVNELKPCLALGFIRNVIDPRHVSMFFPGRGHHHLSVSWDYLVESRVLIPQISIHQDLYLVGFFFVNSGLKGFSKHFRHRGKCHGISIHITVDGGPVACGIIAHRPGD